MSHANAVQWIWLVMAAVPVWLFVRAEGERRRALHGDTSAWVVFGVALPPEAHRDPAVKRLCARARGARLALTVIFVSGAVGQWLVPLTVGLAVALWALWLTLLTTMWFWLDTVCQRWLSRVKAARRLVIRAKTRRVPKERRD